MCRLLPPLLLGLLAAACMGHSYGADAGTGELSLVLTDAATDDLTQFEVDVSDIVLTRLGGGTVSVLPRATRVDFAELDSLSELVAGATLPAGAYTHLAMNFDFHDAQVVLAGQTSPATVVDQQGNPIVGVVPVDVDFPAGARPVVRMGRNNLFVLDLDLAQGIAVDVPGNRVTFTPVLSVDVDPSNPKPVATTGVLQSVDLMGNRFVLERRALDGAPIGTFTVATDGSTVFQLDGVVQAGAPGLGALVGHQGERVYVQGTVSRSLRLLQAAAVESGAGVPGNGQDWVLGHVVGRTGGAGADATLTVIGRSFDVDTGTWRFNTQHTVDVSFADTKVLRRGAGNGLDTDAVNIGQRVWIFGDLTGTALDARAATGVARLLPTSIFGVAASAPAGDTLTVDVARFDHRSVGIFDFTVSGQVQAIPTAYTIDVAGLSTTGISTGSRLRVVSWIGAVGAAGADAQALSIVDRGTTARVLFCQWMPPANGVLAAGPSSTTIAVDVAAAAVRVVGDGFGPFTLASSPVPLLQPLTTIGFYRIVENGSVELNLSFAEFRASLLQRAASHPVFRVSAFGTFAEATQVFSALTATVVLE